MFLWTTTTIINSLKDYSTGDALIQVFDKNFAGASSANKILKIKRDHTFESRYVSKVYKAIANNPTFCEIKVDCSEILSSVDVSKKSAHIRLSFYVSLEGSEESIYANDWYQKGKPFAIGAEIAKGETDAKKVAANLKKNAEKFGVITYGKQIFEIIDNEDGTLNLKGTHEYQRFKVAAVTVDDSIDEHLIDIYEDGVTKVDEATEEGVFTLKNRGINGFGTYSQLVKDLRLPTVHHNKWLQIKEDEKPVIGDKYNQYIITYCAPSMANPGFTVIGQHNMSVTTHVFWVNQKIDEKFAEFLTNAGIGVEVVNSVDDTTGEVTPTEYGVKAEADAGTKYSTNHEQKVVHTEATAAAKVKA